MKKALQNLIRAVYVALGVAVPAFAFAQTTNSKSELDFSHVNNVVNDLLVFIDVTLVPVIFAIAFIIFIWGVFQYFIAGAAKEEKREEGKKFVMWGLIGFVIMVSIWGIVNLLANTLGFNNDTRPKLPTFGNVKEQNSSPTPTPSPVTTPPPSTPKPAPTPGT